MSERYLLTADYVHPAATKRGPEARILRDDLLAGILSALHPAALVEGHRVSPVDHNVVHVGVTLSLAGQGEADDSVERVRNATGLPPVDNVHARHLGTNR